MAVSMEYYPTLLVDAIPGPDNSVILLLALLLLLVVVREVPRMVTRLRDSSAPKPNEIESGSEDDDRGSRPVSGSGQGTGDSAHANAKTTGSSSTNTAESSGIGFFRRWLFFWRSNTGDRTEGKKESSEHDSIMDDHRVDENGLSFTAEFNDLLNEETRQAITDPDIDLGDIDLPPHFEDSDIDPEEFFCKIRRLHQRQIAPDTVEKGDTHYKVGENYRRVLYAHKLPDVTRPAGLREIIEDPSLHFDMMMHFHTLDQEKTLKGVDNLKRNLDASISTTASAGDELAAGDKATRKKKVEEFREEMKQNNERAFELTLYVSVAHKDEKTLLEKVDEIRDAFRKKAGIHLKTVERKQKKALKSVSPLGIDPLYEEDPDIDPSHVALGRSFGALMASLVRSSKFEPTGHEWGVHSVQGQPIVKDPFKSPRNYNVNIVGESGTGKSLNAKQLALNTKAVYPNALIIMLDPLQGFLGLAEALDAKKITIGGNQPINPMEIRKPPDEHIESEAFDDDRDPLSAKINDCMAFIENYVAQQPGLEFGEESQLLRSLIHASYRRQGITDDVQTHDNPSPTLKDVFDLANAAYENPENWTKGPEDEETIKMNASKIGTILREFTSGGQYENLATRPEEDIFAGNDVIYLDLSQQEAGNSSGTGIAGQLLFSTAYELCKQHPGPAVYIIDEARYLFREAETLEYLAQRVRHSRHYQTSIRMITQEMDDFFDFPQAEGIVHNSSFQIIHQSADVDDWGDHFDLKPQHKQFVKNAATGSKHDYSQALVRFPEKDQWYPLTIELGDRMLSIADFDEKEDRYEALPGRGHEHTPMSPVERELVARVRNNAQSHEAELDDILEEWERPMWEMLTTERAERCLERIASGDHPRKALYLESLDQVRWLIDTAGGDKVAPEVAEKLMQAVGQHYDETYNIGTDVEDIKRKLRSNDLELKNPMNQDQAAGGLEDGQVPSQSTGDD